MLKILKNSLIIHWDFKMKIDMEFKGGGGGATQYPIDTLICSIEIKKKDISLY